jgi:hypothetical protein
MVAGPWGHHSSVAAERLARCVGARRRVRPRAGCALGRAAAGSLVQSCRLCPPGGDDRIGATPGCRSARHGHRSSCSRARRAGVLHDGSRGGHERAENSVPRPWAANRRDRSSVLARARYRLVVRRASCARCWPAPSRYWRARLRRWPALSRRREAPQRRNGVAVDCRAATSVLARGWVRNRPWGARAAASRVPAPVAVSAPHRR